MTANGFGLGRGGSSLLVQHQLDADHQAEAANFADERKIALPVVQPGDEIVADFDGMVAEMLFLYELDVGIGGGTGNRIAAEGGQMVPGLKSRCNFVSRG